MKQFVRVLFAISLLGGMFLVSGSQAGGSIDLAESASNDYPTDINDPILEAERDAAALQACRDAKAAMNAPKAEEEAACQEAAKAAWKAKKIEQLTIIEFNSTSTTPTTTSSTTVTTAGSTVEIMVTLPGYWLMDAVGSVYPFGSAQDYDAVVLPAGRSAVDLVANPSGTGYWLLGSDGVVHNRGEAQHFGNFELSLLGTGEDLVSLSAHPSGNGYWIFTSVGRVVSFGVASSFGDLLEIDLVGSVVDAAVTVDGNGYYMAGSDGGVFAFGSAGFFGSMGGVTLNAAINGITPDPDGAGYWLAASDGGIFAFNAVFEGSLGATVLEAPISDATAYGDGYVLVAGDGGVFVYSSFYFLGSLGGQANPVPVVGIAVTSVDVVESVPTTTSTTTPSATATTLAVSTTTTVNSTTTTTAGDSTTTTTAPNSTTTVSPDGPSGSQFMFFAKNLQQTATSYAEPSTSGPSNWKSPVNYANGRMYMKYVVKSKPSSDPLKVQVCLWRHSRDGVRDFKYETCSASKLLTIRDEGTYYVDLGTPSSWWALNDNWDWSKGYDIVRIMHKYTKNGVDYLPMTKSCGSFCLGDEALRMVPIDLRVEMVVVASNNRLTRPSGWTCLSSWNCA